MNIFYLHTHPAIAATYHCDKHVGKMLIESCQMLATAHHTFGHHENITYKPTHANHPSSVWVRESKLHYEWVVILATYLARQFERRYGKPHASAKILVNELTHEPLELANQPATWREPPLCMPEEFHSDNAVLSYRKFYASKAARMPLRYYQGTVPQPQWLLDLMTETTNAE